MFLSRTDAEKVYCEKEFPRAIDREKIKHMCEKFKRFMMLFSADASSLYCSYDEVVFPKRKILCYICEDEDHIAEVHEALLPYLREYPDQEIWYTTDLKMYNYNEEDKRFIVYGENGTASFVNIQERLSLGRERAWQTEP